MSGDHFLNLQPGTIVNGRYEVVKCLGTGSMGMVYACRHRELAGHIVAMKVLFSEVARDEVAAARFRNEIVASYGVSHPNVVRAYEYFRDGDLIAFTMEYIGGGDLADRLSGGEEIPCSEIVILLCQMASGVQAIHDAGIIHRDLKPENILLTAQGDVKITDFGIARIGSGPKLTEHGGVVGTIDYVCPEYLERGQVDRRSDIYALGVLAYEMAAGTSPFKGKSVIETMTMRLHSDPEPPHHVRSDCPVALSNIILKAMSRDPEQRYQHAKEMLEDLDALKVSMGLGGRSGSATDLPTAGSSAFPSADSASVSGVSGAGGGSSLEVGAGGYSGFSETNLSYETAATAQATEATSPLATDVSRGVFSSGSHSSLEKVLAPEYGLSGEAPSVSVSHSSLTNRRIQELSNDLYEAPTKTWGARLSSILIFAIGFGVGLLISQ